jgi:hypothetical protein
MRSAMTAFDSIRWLAPDRTDMEGGADRCDIGRNIMKSQSWTNGHRAQWLERRQCVREFALLQQRAGGDIEQIDIASIELEAPAALGGHGLEFPDLAQHGDVVLDELMFLAAPPTSTPSIARLQPGCPPPPRSAPADAARSPRADFS